MKDYYLLLGINSNNQIINKSNKKIRLEFCYKIFTLFRAKILYVFNGKISGIKNGKNYSKLKK